MAIGDPMNGNIITPDRPVNPAIPDSLGALLAEEWTVNPRSTLPSFLERMMMEEARRSGWETLRSIIGVLEERIDRLGINDESQTTRETDNTGVVEEIRRIYLLLFQQWPVRIAKTFHRNVLKPFGPEIRFSLVYALERGSLLRSNASVADSLYGGKRVKLGEANPSNTNERSLQPLRKQDSLRLAFVLAFGPYLEERSKFFFQHFVRLSRAGEISPISSSRKRLQSILNIVWPLLRMTTKGTFLWYRWRYFLGMSVFFDPYSRLLNLVVRRTTMEDQQQTEISTQSQKGDGVNVVNSNTLRIARVRENILRVVKSSRIRWATGGLTSFCIALAWIARIRSIRQKLRQERELHDLRRIQQRQQRQPYQAENCIDNDVNVNGDPINILIPSPPHPSLSSRGAKRISFEGVRSPIDGNFDVCPLCNQPRIHPTASTGGYVFCLKCILDFLRQNGEVCPVSRKSCPESSLVRLYEPVHRS